MRDYRTIRCDHSSHEREEFIYRIYLIDSVIFKMLYEKSVQQPWNGLLDRASSKVTDTKPMCNPKELPKLKKSTIC